MTPIRALTIAATAVAVAGLAATQYWLGIGLGPHFLELALAAALGDFIRLPREHGRGISLSLVAVGAGALMGASAAALAVFAVIAWLVHSTRMSALGHRPRPVDLAIRVAGSVMLGLVTMAASGAGVPAEPRLPGLVPVIIVWLGMMIVVPLTDEIEHWAFTGARRAHTIGQLLRDNRDVGIALAGISTLAAIVVVELGWLTLPLLGLPLSAARSGLERHEVMRRSTAQTLRAMSRLPEHVGAVEQGHGIRTSQRARSLALSLSLFIDEVEVIERAALLHELGLLRLKDHPDLSVDDAVLATRDIIREAGPFTREAAMVMASHDVAMTPDLERQQDPDMIVLGGAIVRAACHWDEQGPMELVGDHHLPKAVRDAVLSVASRDGVMGLAVAAGGR